MVIAKTYPHTLSASMFCREFIKEHKEEVKRFISGSAMIVVMKNGDEYHFMSGAVLPHWQKGRGNYVLNGVEYVYGMPNGEWKNETD